MDKKTIKQVAWVGDEFVTGEIKGIVLVFHGLGGGLKEAPWLDDLAYAEHGGLVVFPYYGPWSWMNREARAFVDELLDSIIAAYKLPPEIPIVSTGGSMGGFSALLYTRYSRHSISACYANCPVCDLEFHFSERPDLPATIRHAFRGYQDDMETLFREHSPLQQVDALPDIPYLIVHGGKDVAVNKAAHSDKMVARMRNRKLNIEYIEVPFMTHCGAMHQKEWQRIIGFVTGFLK